jgi:HTH-type transcriptional regulator/antitoxin MqsA
MTRTIPKEHGMTKGYSFTCGTCGEGKMRAVSGRYVAEQDDKTYEIAEAEFLQCSQCAAISFTPEQATMLQASITAAQRTAKGLLAPAEVVELRVLLGGITQTELEHLLGTGPKTVSRWERGTVCQNAKADLDMRVIRAVARRTPGIPLAIVVATLRDLPHLIEQIAADQAAASAWAMKGA